MTNTKLFHISLLPFFTFEIMNEHIRSLFPATKHLAYLNSAAVSPMPTTAIDAITGQLADVASHGSTHYQDWIDTKNRVGRIVARRLAR